MANKKDGVWLAELDRFGYILRVVGRTKEEAEDALMKEYVKTYRNRNGSNPKNVSFYGADESFYDVALSDMSVTEMPFGEVDWT